MKPKIILLHGALGNHLQLQSIQSHLKNTYEVFIFTFPGHEINSQHNKAFSIEDFAKGLKEFTKAKQLIGATVIGYSMGGYVALYLQSKEELFSKIITIGTKFNWDKETVIKETAMLNAGVIEEKVPKYAEALKNTFGNEYWKEMLTKTSHLMLELGNGPVLNQANLSNINIPVIVCRGEIDKMVSKEESEIFASYIKTAKFIELKNTPHPIEKLNLEEITNILN